jgi:hypothetical protein
VECKDEYGDTCDCVRCANFRALTAAHEAGLSPAETLEYFVACLNALSGGAITSLILTPDSEADDDEADDGEVMH